jgi:hypothetical protein
MTGWLGDGRSRLLMDHRTPLVITGGVLAFGLLASASCCRMRSQRTRIGRRRKGSAGARISREIAAFCESAF